MRAAILFAALLFAAVVALILSAAAWEYSRTTLAMAHAAEAGELVPCDTDLDCETKNGGSY